LVVSMVETTDGHSVGNWVGLWVVNSAVKMAASMADLRAALRVYHWAAGTAACLVVLLVATMDVSWAAY